MEQSCKRSPDMLSKNISYPAIVELRIMSEKLYSTDLNEEFCGKFGLSSSNMKILRGSLCDMERKGKYTVLL